MNPEAVVFWMLATLTVGSAAVVAFSPSLIRSACALLGAFVGVAGFCLLLGADFVAATQLLVYVGGVLILLVFGVMLTHRVTGEPLRTESRQVAPAALAAGGVFAMLVAAAWKTAWPVGPGRPPADTTADIGRALLGSHLLPFEAASVLLLVALVGAALIVRRKGVPA